MATTEDVLQLANQLAQVRAELAAVQDAAAATIVNEGVLLLEAADGPGPLAVHLWLDA